MKYLIRNQLRLLAFFKIFFGGGGGEWGKGGGGGGSGREGGGEVCVSNIIFPHHYPPCKITNHHAYTSRYSEP